MRRDVLLRVGSATASGKATPLALEVLGYDCDPVFSRRWAALREVNKLASVTQAWQETAPHSIALRPWTTFLPFAVGILQELGWQAVVLSPVSMCGASSGDFAVVWTASGWRIGTAVMPSRGADG